MCQKVGSLGTLQVQITGAVENASSTSALGIDCPIPNPAQGNFAGGTGALNFQKLVYVDHSPGAIRCSLIYEDAGSTAFHLKTQLSVGNDDTVREMQIDAVGAFADGHLHVRCTVPPADASGFRSSVKGMLFGDEDPSSPMCGATVGYHTFPGSNCRKTSTSGSLSITTEGAVRNNLPAGGVAMTVDCPVSATKFPGPSDPPGTTAGQTALWYLDDSTAAVICSLWSEDAATDLFAGLTLSSTANDSVYRSFNFTGSNAVGLFSGGYAHYNCTIPAGTGTDSASIAGYGFAPSSSCVSGLNDAKKRLPGTACVYVSGNGVPGMSIDGSIFNDASNGAQTIDVDCPVVGHQGSQASANVTLQMIDNSPNAIVCSYYSESSNSDDFTGTAQSTNRDDGFNAALTFSVTTIPDGYSHIRCSIPGRDAQGNPSSIKGYEGW